MVDQRHSPYGWACTCGWRPDHNDPTGLGVQQQSHLEENGWTQQVRHVKISGPDWQ